MKSKLESALFAALGALVVAGAAILGVVVTLALAAVSSVMVAMPLWLAWNYAAVPVFEAPRITFLQMWALWFIVGTVLGALRRRRV